jgi:hypothetical protein
LSTSTSQQPLLDNVVSGDSVLNAEVYHCLNLISKHNSYNSMPSTCPVYTQCLQRAQSTPNAFNMPSLHPMPSTCPATHQGLKYC